jgi:hypothetical protein
MHTHTSTALIVAALVAAAYLLFGKVDRLWPMVAVIVAGLEALIAFKILTMSLKTFRIDLALAAALCVAGAVAWHKSSTKGAVSAAAAVTLIGLLQLLTALHVLR